MKKFLRWFAAYFRLNLRIVCEESKNGKDYHDYPDDVVGVPMHWAEMTCERCGKKFYL
jgi:hypothetical protein